MKSSGPTKKATMMVLSGPMKRTSRKHKRPIRKPLIALVQSLKTVSKIWALSVKAAAMENQLKTKKTNLDDFVNFQM